MNLTRAVPGAFRIAHWYCIRIHLCPSVVQTVKFFARREDFCVSVGNQGSVPSVFSCWNSKHTGCCRPCRGFCRMKGSSPGLTPGVTCCRPYRDCRGTGVHSTSATRQALNEICVDSCHSWSKDLVPAPPGQEIRGCLLSLGSRLFASIRSF